MNIQNGYITGKIQFSLFALKRNMSLGIIKITDTLKHGLTQKYVILLAKREWCGVCGRV